MKKGVFWLVLIIVSIGFLVGCYSDQTLVKKTALLEMGEEGTDYWIRDNTFAGVYSVTIQKELLDSVLGKNEHYALTLGGVGYAFTKNPFNQALYEVTVPDHFTIDEIKKGEVAKNKASNNKRQKRDDIFIDTVTIEKYEEMNGCHLYEIETNLFMSMRNAGVFVFSPGGEFYIPQYLKSSEGNCYEVSLFISARNAAANPTITGAFELLKAQPNHEELLVDLNPNVVKFEDGEIKIYPPEDPRRNLRELGNEGELSEADNVYNILENNLVSVWQVSIKASRLPEPEKSAKGWKLLLDYEEYIFRENTFNPDIYEISIPFSVTDDIEQIRDGIFLTMDVIPPTIKKVSGTIGETTEASARFVWEGEDSDGEIDHYQYSKDGEIGTTENTEFVWEGYGEGEHVFSVKAIDSDGAESEIISWYFNYLGNPYRTCLEIWNNVEQNYVDYGMYVEFANMQELNKVSEIYAYHPDTEQRLDFFTNEDCVRYEYNFHELSVDDIPYNQTSSITIKYKDGTLETAEITGPNVEPVFFETDFDMAGIPAGNVNLGDDINLTWENLPGIDHICIPLWKVNGHDLDWRWDHIYPAPETGGTIPGSELSEDGVFVTRVEQKIHQDNGNSFISYKERSFPVGNVPDFQFKLYLQRWDAGFWNEVILSIYNQQIADNVSNVYMEGDGITGRENLYLREGQQPVTYSNWLDFNVEKDNVYTISIEENDTNSAVAKHKRGITHSASAVVTINPGIVNLLMPEPNETLNLQNDHIHVEWSYDDLESGLVPEKFTVLVYELFDEYEEVIFYQEMEGFSFDIDTNVFSANKNYRIQIVSENIEVENGPNLLIYNSTGIVQVNTPALF